MKLLLLLPLSLLVLIPILGNCLQGDSHGRMRCLERERQALLDFKHQLVDIHGRLSSWIDQTDCCKWTGVSCHNRTNHVMRLDLRNPWADDPSTDYAPLQGMISISLVELQNLKHLDLSRNDFSYSPIPKFIGSLTKLRYLDLHFANFSGPIPPHLGNLSELLYLDLGANDYCYSKSLDWFSRLHSLEYLDLSHTNLSEATNWLHSVSTLNSVKELDLSYALPEIPPSVLLAINLSAPLSILYLSGNNWYLSSPLTLIRWFSNFSSTGLTSVGLSHNIMQGGIPRFFGNMSSLVGLDLSHNNLSGELSELMMNLSGPVERQLQYLDLSRNRIHGLLPNMSKFSSLKELCLPGNRLNGSIQEGYLQLPNLVVLRMSSNRLEGMITEAHMMSLPRLKTLDLSLNSLLEVKPSHEWVPPFQLQGLYLSHCRLGPHFPMWLKTQKEISRVDISNTGISDIIPGWFCDMAIKVHYLYASMNKISGTFPHFSLPTIDPSTNQIYGTFPYFPLPPSALKNMPVSRYYDYEKVLDLSGNQISGSINFLCHSRKWTLLDLSNNQFSDQIPDCFANFEMLMYLNLANNNLSGEIPFAFGSLIALSLLHLQNNRFSGEIPTSMRNCTNLKMIDLGHNRLTGNLPSWTGDSLLELIVLVLRGNEFYGSIPSNLCGLANIQILDISSNNISGAIPQCLHNFTAMTEKDNNDLFPDYQWENVGERRKWFAGYIKQFNFAYFMWKGMEVKYRNNLSLVKLIDLSSNNLVGEIPSNITKLIGLVALNLSKNNLVGSIPQDIGELRSLEFLDFSRNHLSGRIPISLGELGYLGVLNLSYNNLSGRIPEVPKLQTFDQAYVGNSGLCGLPLNKSCPGDEDVNNSTKDEEFEDDDDFITQGFYVALAVGFVVGFWGVFGTILFNRASRHAFFMALDAFADFVYVRMKLSKSHLLRHFRNHSDISRRNT